MTKRLFGNTQGVVMMEFLVALIPVMVAFLALVQFAFAASAKLVVRHAAAMGVRAAVVVIEEYDTLPGTPLGIYNGLPAGVLEEQPRSEDPASGNQSARLRSIVAAVRSRQSVFDEVKAIYDTNEIDNSRIKEIRKAAAHPLLSVSPNVINEELEFIVGDSAAQNTVETAIGDWGARRLVGAFLYNLGAVAVSFPKSAQATEYQNEPYEPGADVTVRVSYLFRCRVPFVSILMCDAGSALFSGSVWSDPAVFWEARRLTNERPTRLSEVAQWSRQLDGLRSRLAQRQKRIEAFNGRSDDFERVESPAIQRLLLFQPGARYMLIQAEATLPLQSARYYPRGN